MNRLSIYILPVGTKGLMLTSSVEEESHKRLCVCKPGSCGTSCPQTGGQWMWFEISGMCSRLTLRYWTHEYNTVQSAFTISRRIMSPYRSGMPWPSADVITEGDRLQQASLVSPDVRIRSWREIKSSLSNQATTLHWFLKLVELADSIKQVLVCKSRVVRTLPDT